MKENEPLPPTTLQVHPAGSAAEQAQQLARHIARRLREAITVRGHAVLAVSGGKSPVAMFEQLREQPLEWARVTVVLVDERCVPHDHPESNTALVRQHLLQDAAAAATCGKPAPRAHKTKQQQPVIRRRKRRIRFKCTVPS